MMINLVNIIPFLAALLLLINPVLLLLYQRWEINTRKLRFWFMATSGAAWILLLLLSLIGPEREISQTWVSNSQLLAIPVIYFDWISISLALALGGLAFYSTVSQVFSPQQSAWITGLGGICILGTLAGSVFTILFFWTLVEVFWITYSALYQSRDQGLILPVLFRLLIPLILIYASVIGRAEGLGDSFSTYTSAAGPILIAAGCLGFGAWIPFRRRVTQEDPGGNAEFVARLFPAGISLMLISRGAMLLENNDLDSTIPLLVAIFTLLFGLLGLISRSRGFSRRIWSLGILGLITGSALIASPAGSLGWGLVFILAVSSLFFPFQDMSRLFPALVIAAIGILPLPYFPAWIGRHLFSSGLAGVLNGIGAGLILGGILWGAKTRVSQTSFSTSKTPLLYLLSPVINLLTQIIIIIPLIIKDFGQGIFSQSLMIWIPLPLILLTIIFRDRIADFSSIHIDNKVSRSLDVIPVGFSSLGAFGDRIVSFITDLFEGEGGLIWALLIGFLLITLITIRGGS